MGSLDSAFGSNGEAGFEPDDFYESFLAPKFHDFTAPEEPIDPDEYFMAKPGMYPIPPLSSLSCHEFNTFDGSGGIGISCRESQSARMHFISLVEVRESGRWSVGFWKTGFHFRNATCTIRLPFCK
jgi:hypothetical protein